MQCLLTGPASGRYAALTAVVPGIAEQSPPLHEYIHQEMARLSDWLELAAAVPNTTRSTVFAGEGLNRHIELSKRCLVKAIGLLAQRGQSEAMDLVAASLKASDTQMQATAVQVLDQIGDKTLAKQIIPLLEDKPPQVGDGQTSTLSPATA